MDLTGEPDAGKLPVAPDGAERDFEDLHDLLFAQSAEITQFHDFGLARSDLRECGKRVIERDQGTIGLVLGSTTLPNATINLGSMTIQ